MADTPPPPKSAESRRPDEGGVTYLDQALWKQLHEAQNDGEFCTGWLGLQSRMMNGVHGGMVVLGPAEKGPYIPAAFWPREMKDPAILAGATERVLKERKGVVIKADGRDDPASAEKGTFFIAYPVRVEDKLYGVASLEISARAHDQLQSAMRQLQWGVAWIENWIRRRESDHENRTKKRITTALDLAAVALQEERFRASATAFATLLATRLRCDRVSIGFLKGKQIRVHALSHSAQFKKQMNLIRSIGYAMDESIDQEAVLTYPGSAGTGNRILRAHSDLAQQHGDGAICTIPFLNKEGKGYGALTLERAGDESFEAEAVELCESVAALVAPILEEKRKNDRLIFVKIAESLRMQVSKFLGPGHMAFKLIAAAVVVLTVFFAFATGNYRITAKTTIEGEVQRAVVVPYNGYIDEAYVRAGDLVREGQVMCSLDDRDMSLERLRWQSQREQYLRQYREAMASGNRANMKILREQVNQADAQIELLSEQIARTKMVAPFEGVVVNGDLSQSLGAPVERGQVLFEVAPLQKYRVKLQVDERDIGWISVGQGGDLILNSLPESTFPITVEKITPVSIPREGRNYFIVEARLGQVSESLRPGMEGFGKVGVGRAKLFWIWTHDLLDWVRLWVWSWWP